MERHYTILKRWWQKNIHKQSITTSANKTSVIIYRIVREGCMNRSCWLRRALFQISPINRSSQQVVFAPHYIFTSFFSLILTLASIHVYFFSNCNLACLKIYLLLFDWNITILITDDLFIKYFIKITDRYRFFSFFI